MFDLYNLFYIPTYQGHIKISWAKEIASNESIRSPGLHCACIQGLPLTTRLCIHILPIGHSPGKGAVLNLPGLIFCCWMNIDLRKKLSLAWKNTCFGSLGLCPEIHIYCICLKWYREGWFGNRRDSWRIWHGLKNLIGKLKTTTVWTLIQ